MPIALLSLPAKDLQYAINSMNVRDVLAFSLCSNRTKNLVKSSNVEVKRICAEVYQNEIILEVLTYQYQRHGWSFYENKIKFVLCVDSSIEYEREDGFQEWKNTELTFSHLIAHFLSLSTVPILRVLEIKNSNSITYLDTVKQLIQRCLKLHISYRCSKEFTKVAFLKLCYIADTVEIDNNPFDNETDISQLLTPNLKSVTLHDWDGQFKLELDDLLTLNITDLTISPTNISGKELNRFLKLWMKGNHRFYRPKQLFLIIRNEINREEVFKDIKFQSVDHVCLLKRVDGKGLLVDIGLRYVIFKFHNL